MSLRPFIRTRSVPDEGVASPEPPVPPARPENFDWREYLARYEDLRDAGIEGKEAARNHWVHWGQSEGRWGARGSYPTRRTLACPSIHSLYLRATGTLVCWDDAGNDTVLQSFDPTVDYARDVYLGPVFNRLRFSLSTGRMPFPKVCQRCLVLRTDTLHSSFHLDHRVMEVFQVEPSFRCSLDCPGCVRLDQRKLAPPLNLDPSMLRKILGDLASGGVTVRAFDFQGHGEPLMNRDLWDLTRMARAFYADSYITVTTNAQGIVRPSAGAAQIDEIICSIDGVDQETFAPYRINGRFDTAYRFMRDFASLGAHFERPAKVIWKYILFEHNSAPEHIRRVQDLAEEAGVGEVVFVFTRNGPRSLRVSNPADLDLRESSVPVSVRYHEPETGDLLQRLREAAENLTTGADSAAADLVLSVARNLVRFFAGAPLDAEQEALVGEITRLAERLPAERRLEVLAQTKQLDGAQSEPRSPLPATAGRGPG